MANYGATACLQDAPGRQVRGGGAGLRRAAVTAAAEGAAGAAGTPAGAAADRTARLLEGVQVRRHALVVHWHRAARLQWPAGKVNNTHKSDCFYNSCKALTSVTRVAECIGLPNCTAWTGACAAMQHQTPDVVANAICFRPDKHLGGRCFAPAAERGVWSRQWIAG